MTLMLVEYALYWANAIPSTIGISDETSPSTIVEGKSKPNFQYKHLAFGTYCMVYIGTKNNMKARSVPGLALSPSNEWGGHYFMSLLTGRKIHGYKWIEVPMGQDVIDRVHALAQDEKQPALVDGTVAFEWGMNVTKPNEEMNRNNDEYEYEFEENNEIENENNFEEPTDVLHIDTDTDEHLLEEQMNSAIQDMSDADSEVLNDDDIDNENDFFDNNDNDVNHKIDTITNQISEQLQNEEEHLESIRTTNMLLDHNDRIDEPNFDNNDSRTKDTVFDQSHSSSTPSTGDPQPLHTRPRRKNAGTGVMTLEPSLGGKEHVIYKKKCMLQYQHQRFNRNTKRAKISLLMRKTSRDSKLNTCMFQKAVHVTFLSAQMSGKRGIKVFGERATAAFIKECTQLDKGAFPGKPVVEPLYKHELSNEEKTMAMGAVCLIKEKRDGTVKARICANGSKQKKYLQPEESITSPTSSNEGVLASFMIDAYEKRTVAVLDIPGAYLHAKVKHGKSRVIMKLQGEYVEYMCKSNEAYRKYVCYVNGVKTLYLKLLRALYGCIKSALLWYELFTSKLQKMGFELNPYNKCVANKTVNGKQCTVLWYVDDVKVSHVEKGVVQNVINEIEKEFGNVKPTIGNEQEYLGMKIKIDNDRNLHIDMRDQVSEIIQEFSENLSGTVSSPAKRTLMDVNDEDELLNISKADEFHSVVAKLLYLEKRGRPDLEPTVAFLSTRVSKPNITDWRKLIRLMIFLQQTKDDVRVIKCDDITKIFTWIDAAYAVHHNMRSHTGGTISFGTGVVHAKSSKQKLNTKSSTEAELVGLSEYLPYNIWLLNFLNAQGYRIESNIVFQDNQSAIRMENNGRNSCTGNSRHINIRYYFVKDRVDKGELVIQYCPTLDMLADYFTKPLQGSLFRKFREIIMGWKHINTLKSNPYDANNLKERVENTNVNKVVRLVPSTNSEMIQMGDKYGTNTSPTPSYADIVKGKGTNGSESKTPFENQ